MVRSLRVALVAGAGLLWASGALRADTINRAPAPLPNVTVVKETFKKVVYKIGDTTIQNEMDRKKDRVSGVEYDEWPEGWIEGHEALAASNFQSALENFADVAKAGSEEYPQGKQYGMYWMGESFRRWGESGNGKALNDAVAKFNELLKIEPETVFAARVHLGLGSCYLLLGNTAEAVKEFDLVLGEEYFTEQDKISAKIGKAQVAETEKKWQAALGEYTAILQEASKSAPTMTPLVKVRMANCSLNLGKVDEAKDEFSRILASGELPEKERASIRASALNGRGECGWKNKDYEKAMWDFLRVVVLYEAVTSESPKAFYYASQCMRNYSRVLEKDNKKEEARVWKIRANDLEKELKEKFPGSPWARGG